MRLKLILAGLLLTQWAACTTVQQGGEVKTIIVRETVNELQKEPVPGTVQDAWVEPMQDVVCEPGRIDRRNVYYRKGTCTIYENRLDKFQKVQYPDFNGQYPSR